MKPSKYLYNIFPDIIYVIDRHADNLSWNLDDCIAFYNLMLIYDGEAEFTCNNTTVEASSGYLLFHKPGDVRKAHTFAEAPLKSYAIDFFYTCPILENGQWRFTHPELPFDYYQKIDDKELFSRLLELFSRLNRIHLSTKDTKAVDERLIFTEILTQLFKYKEVNEYNYANSRKVDKIINYMTENYMENLTIQQIAEHSNISPSYLGNIFRKVTGKSTIEYLINIRINKSKALLKDGFSVSDTSKLVGFNDIFYFSKAFKKHEGMSPSQYADLESSESPELLGN